MKLAAAIRAYFGAGGKHVQFIIEDNETLKDAKLHPEAVSYTHLDVYKRQERVLCAVPAARFWKPSCFLLRGCRTGQRQGCLLYTSIILLINIFAGAPYCGIPSRRLKVERHGCVCLTVFLLTVVVSAAFHVWLGIELWAYEKTGFIISALWCGLSLVLIFWNGIISVYLVSVQLGIRIRIIGILCGWIPVSYTHLDVYKRQHQSHTLVTCYE